MWLDSGSAPATGGRNLAGGAHTAATPFVEFENVELIYDEDGADAVPAISSLSFNIAQGDFVAVVGPSGCGKSTLMKLATGLVTPTAGEVRVNGMAVHGPIDGVGMAFQAPTLLPWRTTLQNVLLPLEIVAPWRDTPRRDRGLLNARAMALLDAVGLAAFAGKFPWQLSGGMQQRANLCRALIHSPQLLMLDEPFGALDAFTREDLWGVLQRLWLERKFTTVLVTHDLREAVFLADHVFVLGTRPGKLIYQRRVSLPRPRRLDVTFSEPFVELVHDLRARIEQPAA